MRLARRRYGVRSDRRANRLGLGGCRGSRGCVVTHALQGRTSIRTAAQYAHPYAKAKKSTTGLDWRLAHWLTGSPRSDSEGRSMPWVVPCIRGGPMKRQRATWAILFVAMSAGACPSRDTWRDRGGSSSALPHSLISAAARRQRVCGAWVCGCVTLIARWVGKVLYGVL